jgi:hypothetical protein
MVLANVAWLLAAAGRRVLVIDWDLEAPGLHRYFRPFLIDPELFETDGLIDMFWNFAAGALERASANPQVVDRDEETVAAALDGATRGLDWEFPTGGSIDFIGAGRQGATYSKRVNTFEWTRFYELGGARFLNEVKTYLREQYEYVLVDSRTGASDTSGICTIQMPDDVVACFTLNRQSIDGVAAILGSIRAYRSASLDGSAINFFPIAMRIENSEKDKLDRARGYARAALAPFLPKDAQAQTRAYWDDMEIAYRPYYAYEEVLAAFGDSTGAVGAADTLLAQIELTARRVTGNPELTMPEMVESDRIRVLAEYAFGEPASAPTTKSEDGGEVDAADTEFLRTIYAKEQLWRKSGFDYRNLLSQRELDLVTESDRERFGRQMAFYYTNSVRLSNFRDLANTAFSLWLFLPLLTAFAVVIIQYVGSSTAVFSTKTRHVQSSDCDVLHRLARQHPLALPTPRKTVRDVVG